SMRWIFSKTLWIFVVLALVAAAAWMKLRTPSEPDHTTGVVARGDVVQRVTISGLVTPIRTASLTSPYDGYIQKMFVEIGQKVKKGEPIVTISQTPDGSMEQIFPLRAPFAGEVVQVLKTEGANVVGSTSSSTDKSVVRIDDLSKLFVLSDTPEIDYP